jgi:hypothetical protein
MPRTERKSEAEWTTLDALPPDARVRLDHAGEWVAWDRGMTRAVASGSDPEAVHAEAVRAGVARPILEWVPLAPTPTRADGGPATPGLVAHHRAFSSFNQISASMRRNWTS